MIRFGIYEAFKYVGAIDNESGNVHDALLDFWNSFLRDDGNYVQRFIVGNSMVCSFKGTQPRTFIARPD